MYRQLSCTFLQGVCTRKQPYNDSEKTWKSTATRSNKKGKAGRFYPMEEAREKEKDIRSREVSPYNRLGSLTYASLLCMPSPPPSYLGLLFLYSVPWNVLLLLPFRSRCTVAFGLCIIITVTASSSWLLVEKSHLVPTPPPLAVFSLTPIFCFVDVVLVVCS